MKAVCNTSPLIFLTKIERLDFLNSYSLIIPEQVFQEISEWEKIDTESHFRLKDWIGKNRVAVKKAGFMTNLPESLGKGEKAAISLAMNEGIKVILVDEKKARTLAKSLGLAPAGTIAIVHQQLAEKKITKAECKNLVLELVKKGYRIKEELLAEFLQNLESKK